MKTLAFLLAAYAAAVVLIAIFQRRLQYFPDTRLAAAAEAGVNGLEDLRLQTADGETLVAWRMAPKAGRPLLLYFHGNGGSLRDRAARFRLFAASGYGLLAVSYRGYGGSSGTPTQDGLILDGEAAWRAAQASGADPRRVVIVGESLGTAIAARIARDHGCAALVFDSAFSSALDVAEAHYWMLPVRRFLRDAYRTDLAIGDVRAPVLFVHGEEDFIVPIRLARRLFDLANEPKTFISAPGAGHLVLDLPQVYPQARAWIDAAIGSDLQDAPAKQ